MAASIMYRSYALKDNVDDLAEGFLVPKAVFGKEGFGYDRPHGGQ